MNPFVMFWLALGVAVGALFEAILDNREERKRRNRWER